MTGCVCIALLPLEFSAVKEMLYICTLHWSRHVTTEYLRVAGETEELKFLFYLMLMNLHLNLTSLVWLWLP